MLIFSIIGMLYLSQQINYDENITLQNQPSISILSADKGYGVTVDLTQYSSHELQTQLDEMQSANFTWLRQSFCWSDIEPRQNQYNWQKYDRIVEAAHKRGFKILAVLETSPPWARVGGTPPETPPTEALHFGEFARQVALRYGDKILHYQIWHEPNLAYYWGRRYPSAKEYVLMLKNANINIHDVQPSAVIVLAGLAPTTENGPYNFNEFTFLEAIYKASGSDWFDVVAGQLYGFHLPAVPVEHDKNLLNIHRVMYLREIMDANHDEHKPIWATAFGWHTLPQNWQGQPPPIASDIPEKQRKRTEEAIIFARDTWDWLGPIFAIRWDDYGLAEDDSTRGFAVKPQFLETFRFAGQNLGHTATVGKYSATHPSGQYSDDWSYGYGMADVPIPSDRANVGVYGHKPLLHPTLKITFKGTRLDLAVNRGLFRGHMLVTIDGQPANALPYDEYGRTYIILYDPLYGKENITLARNLPFGMHEAIIQVEGGWNQWIISGWQVYTETNLWLLKSLLLVMLAIAIASIGGIVWHSWALRPFLRRFVEYLQKRYNRFSDTSQITLTFLIVICFVFAPDSIALLLLPLIALAFILRPDIGLMVLTFGIPFYLVKRPLVIDAVLMLELGLVILTFAVCLRLILHAPSDFKTTLRHAINFLFHRMDFQSIHSKLSRLNSTDFAVLSLFVVAIISTMFAKIRGVAIYELRTVIIEPIIFYSLIRIVFYLSNKEMTSRIPVLHGRLTDAFLLGTALHSATALYQYWFAPYQTIETEGVSRAIGYLYGSPNNLALILDRAFPLILVIVMFRVFVGQASMSDKFAMWRKIGYVIALLIISMGIFFTYSRGSLLMALPISIMLMALLKGGKRAWLAAAISLIILVLALVPLRNTDRLKNTLSFEPGTTAFIRINLWQSAWQMFQDNPLTGVGLDNFLYRYRTRYITPAAWADPNLNHPHNVILDFATRLGIGGVFALIWLQYCFWHGAWRAYYTQENSYNRLLLLGWIGSMSTFLVHGLVDNSFFLVDLSFTFFLSLGIVEAISANRYERGAKTLVD